MSKVFTKNKKELSGVKLIPATTAWEMGSDGKYRLRKDIDIVGKIDTSMSNMVLKANKEGKRTDFIDDVSELPRRTKREIVGHFYDNDGKRNKKTVAYLIRTDQKSKGSK